MRAGIFGVRAWAVAGRVMHSWTGFISVEVFASIPCNTHVDTTVGQDETCRVARGRGGPHRSTAFTPPGPNSPFQDPVFPNSRSVSYERVGT